MDYSLIFTKKDIQSQRAKLKGQIVRLSNSAKKKKKNRNVALLMEHTMKSLDLPNISFQSFKKF